MVLSFGIIGHFVSMDHFWEVLTSGYPFKIKKRSKALISQLLEWTPPFSSPLTVPQKSKTGQKIRGYPVMCPLISGQMLMLDEEFVIQKIVKAVNMAKDLGARLAVLTGFTSVVGNQGEVVSQQVGIPVTTGNSYTAALTIRGVKKAVQLMDLPLPSAKVAIIGATGDIGSVCAKILAKEVRHLILVARDRIKLEQFGRYIQNEYNIAVDINTKPAEAVKDADVIISVTSSVTTLINAQDLKPGAIVCDVAIPKNIAVEISKEREDVFVFDGGMVELLQEIYFPGLSRGYMAGCVAEAMVLTMEKRFECFSLGRGNITPEKVLEIDAMGEKHGFRLENLKIGEKVYQPQDIEKIKAHIP